MTVMNRWFGGSSGNSQLNVIKSSLQETTPSVLSSRSSPKQRNEIFGYYKSHFEMLKKYLFVNGINSVSQQWTQWALWFYNQRLLSWLRQQVNQIYRRMNKTELSLPVNGEQQLISSVKHSTAFTFVKDSLCSLQYFNDDNVGLIKYL